MDELENYFEQSPTVGGEQAVADHVEGKRIVPEPGRYALLPDDVYHHTWEALNNGRLTDLARSAAFCRWRMEHPEVEVDSPAKRLGRAAHCAVLEPERFETLYEIDPPPPAERVASGKGKAGWHNTKEYKAARDDLQAHGFILLPQDAWDTCLAIRDRLYRTPSAARDLLALMTESEVSYVADDPATGMRCKIRVDLDAEGSGITADMKTARDARPWAFSKQLYDLGYHRSKAFYQRTLEAHAPGAYDTHVFLVVETEAPWETVVYNLDEEATAFGRDKVNELMLYYKQCRDEKRWPGYGSEVATIGLPAYAYYNRKG